MRPGERQVSPTIDGIRADHVNRYKWVIEHLPKGSVIDAACGIGYGSYIMAEAGFNVRSVEIDPEAVEYGEAHYPHKRIYRQCEDLYKANLASDPVVAFECIEHVPDPLPILKNCNDLLISSVPNEEVFPFRNHLYHYRHYTKEQFNDLLMSAGYTVKSWWGQENEYSPVVENVNGRTLIAIAERE